MPSKSESCSKSTLLTYFQLINDSDHHRVPSLSSDDEQHQQPSDFDLDFNSPETFFDLPPESFWLPECHEQDWFQLNAVMERKRSKKFSNSGADAGGIKSSNHQKQHDLKSSSSRFFWSSVKNIGSLNPHKSCLVGRNNNNYNNKAGMTRLFRSRSEPVGKLVMEASEPNSPRVSCMGRVANDSQIIPKKIGIWRSFKSIFRNRS